MPKPVALHTLASAPLDHDLALKMADLVKAAGDPPLTAAGEPGKFTPDVLQRIVAALRLGHTINDACVFAGVRVKTYQNWLRKGQNGEGPYDLLCDVIERLKLQKLTPAVECFHNAATEDWKAAERLLARAHPKEWGTKSENEGSGVTVMFGLELKGYGD